MESQDPLVRMIDIDEYSFRLTINISSKEPSKESLGKSMIISLIETSIQTEYEGTYTSEKIHEITQKQGIPLDISDIYHLIKTSIGPGLEDCYLSFEDEEICGKTGMDRTILFHLKSQFKSGDLIKKSHYVFPLNSKSKPFIERMEQFVIGANRKISDIHTRMAQSEKNIEHIMNTVSSNPCDNISIIHSVEGINKILSSQKNIIDICYEINNELSETRQEIENIKKSIDELKKPQIPVFTRGLRC